MRALLNLWCRLTHGTPMQPIRGKYICRVCLREFPVRWALDTEGAERGMVLSMEE